MMKVTVLGSIICSLFLMTFASHDKLDQMISLKKTILQQTIARTLALKQSDALSEIPVLQNILAKAQKYIDLPQTPRKANVNATAQDLLDILAQERNDTIPLFKPAVEHLNDYYVQIVEAINATIDKGSDLINDQSDRFANRLQQIKDSAGDTDISSCLGYNEFELNNLRDEGEEYVLTCVESLNKTSDSVLKSTRFAYYNAIRVLDRLTDQVKACANQNCLDNVESAIQDKYAPNIIPSTQADAEQFVENTISLVGICADKSLLRILGTGNVILARIQECVDNL